MSSPPPTSPKSLQPYVYPVKSLLSRRIKPESEQEALVTSNTRSQVAPPDPDRLPLNPSECGIVHLPPVSPSLSKTRNSSPSDPNHSLASSKMSSYRSNSPSNDLTRMASPTSFSSESLNLALDSQSEAVFEVQSESLTSTSSTDPLVTFRFQHAQDKYGNHVVIGREGKLERCEDEPIRTPGAVQAFGVLIVVEESEDALVVRQVSDNSTELLGLSPRYLFSLECFTDVLPDSQAAFLWDNIQFLNELDNSNERDDGSPHVFLLSGWGAPHPETNLGRRSWTCWCAVHHAASYNEGKPLHSNLIIMEFELERDTINPLYPPALPETGLISSSTDGCDHTTVTHDMESAVDQIFSPTSSSSGGDFSDNSSLPTTAKGGTTPESLSGLDGPNDWQPSAEDILESTINHAKPLPALERLRKMTKTNTPSPNIDVVDHSTSPGRSRARRGKLSRGDAPGVGMLDAFAVMGQINEQFEAATSLDMFLKVVVGVIRDLTQFHRVLVYQFDDAWNGQVVAELVDWSQTRDLYRGLHFPASDIPAQARALYAINKVRLLYDRSQATARIVVRSKEDLEVPLDMTHCYLRAMSPIHIKYLANMGVRASMSVSIKAFGTLWGLVTCHSYGSHGMRVSFPLRQMLRLLSQAISRNIERLSYTQRLHTRKLMNTIVSNRHSTGYIVSNTEDLLGLFDADFGILVIGEGAKILGPNQHGQEILIMAEYLRLKQFDTIQASRAVTKDFQDLELTTGLQAIAGLLHVPLSSGGKDFIAFLRKGEPQHVRWAGKPYKDGVGTQATLEPRKSFKIWSETVAGQCRAWTYEQLETAGVLALVYGKFIEVWRQKESALQTTKLTNLLLSNASHEVRTPLNHIINYLEMALDGPLDGETRDNLSQSHAASKSLLFTINDLLDLTRHESGNATSFNEPFDLHDVIREATRLYRREAERRKVSFILELEESPRNVVGDAKKIRTVVQNLTGNSLKYTEKGSITVRCSTSSGPEGLRDQQHTAVEIVVADTGCGIQSDKLEHIFREFEQVESSEQKPAGESGVGFGLAVVARIVEQLGGQLRVDSKVNEGSRFSFLIPLALSMEEDTRSALTSSSRSYQSLHGSIPKHTQRPSQSSEIESLVEALTSNYMSNVSGNSSPQDGNKSVEDVTTPRRGSAPGALEAPGYQQHVRPVKVDNHDLDIAMMKQLSPSKSVWKPQAAHSRVDNDTDPTKLRVLVVEDDKINRTILSKRLRLDGHVVVNSTNGQEGLDTVTSDRSFDAILMDIRMPILNGFEATQRIRDLEKSEASKSAAHTMQLSHQINGRIPIFAVSASLSESQREELLNCGVDGWILKPIDFHRLQVILKGVTDPVQRRRDVYRPGCNWEIGGWLRD